MCDICLDSHVQLNALVPVNKEQQKFVKYCELNGIKYALKT